MAKGFKPFNKASSKGFSTPENQSPGILDDHAVRKNIATQESNIKDINKSLNDNGGHDTLNIHGVLYCNAPIGIGLDVLHSAIIGNHLEVLNNLTVSGTIINTDFTTLTDNQMANSLHRHSFLSASDGNPPNAFLIDQYGDSHMLYDRSFFMGESNDYQIQWEGENNRAIHTITSGNFGFIGGNFGLGTKSPVSALHIKKSIAGNVSNTIENSQTPAATTNISSFDFKCRTSTQERTTGSIYTNFENVTDATRTGRIRFGAFNMGAWSYHRICILGDKVGIGTDTPTSKLQVVGLPVYATNALALSGGLTAGAFYRTGADPDPVCVVH